MFFGPKCNIYITSQDNGVFFQGYLDGTARHGYTRIQRKVTNVTYPVEHDHAVQRGDIKLKGLRLVVSSHDGGEEWQIESTVDGKIRRGVGYSR